jgi:hypothetical protein
MSSSCEHCGIYDIYVCLGCNVCIECNNESTSYCINCSYCNLCANQCKNCKCCLVCSNECIHCGNCDACCKLQDKTFIIPFTGYDKIIEAPTRWERLVSYATGSYDESTDIVGVYTRKNKKRFILDTMLKLPRCSAPDLKGVKSQIIVENVLQLPLPREYKLDILKWLLERIN